MELRRSLRVWQMRRENMDLRLLLSKQNGTTKRCSIRLAFFVSNRRFCDHDKNLLPQQAFCLNVPYDTLCFVVISNQSMFQSTFVPYVLKMASEDKDWLDVATDPLDQCMRDTFVKVLSSSFSPNEGIDVYHSFDKDEQGQHTLSCQTAATVAGN